MPLLEVLTSDHREFLRMLDVLDAMAGRLARGRPVPPGMATDVLDYFAQFAGRHHATEESVLFPLLAGHGIGADQSVVHALISQHETGRQYDSKLRGSIRRLDAGDGGAAEAFQADVQGFTELLREHIRIEDAYFYKLADQVLSAAERSLALAAFAGQEADGAAARARFVGMIDAYAPIVAGWAAEG